jgi:RimJ/RimL family protein N-acetyltransferase
MRVKNLFNPQIINIRGDIMKGGNIYLRPLTLSDTDLIVKWRNTDSVRKNLFSQELITPESHKKYYNEYIETHKCHQFILEQIVYENGNIYSFSVPVGTVYLKNIDHLNSKALIGVFIGEGVDRGKGFGKEAVQLILQYGFLQLGLNKVYLQVIYNNEKMIGICEEIGFVKEGKFREDYFRDGVYYDIEQLSILKSDFLHNIKID